MPMDNNKARPATGQALQRLLLVATIAGYWMSYLNQPIEVSELCTSLAVELRTSRYPQILLRVGPRFHGAAFTVTSDSRRTVVTNVP